jgi:hypothetical protein
VTVEGQTVIVCTEVLYRVAVEYPITRGFVNVVWYPAVSVVGTGSSSAMVLVVR